MTSYWLEKVFPGPSHLPAAGIDHVCEWQEVRVLGDPLKVCLVQLGPKTFPFFLLGTGLGRTRQMLATGRRCSKYNLTALCGTYHLRIQLLHVG